MKHTFTVQWLDWVELGDEPLSVLHRRGAGGDHDSGRASHSEQRWKVEGQQGYRPGGVPPVRSEYYKSLCLFSLYEVT